MKNQMSVLLFATAALFGCNGSDPIQTMDQCVTPMIPRLLACIPADYQGRDAGPLRACFELDPQMLDALRICRIDAHAEFAAALDQRIGHEARVLVEFLLKQPRI